MKIQRKFIKYNYSKRTSPIKYIVIHDVGVKGSTAMNNYNYFNSGYRGSSADFFVDKNSNNIIQTVDYTKHFSWHCGDGNGKYGITNGNSIGIEMCLVEPYDKVIENTIELVKYLMKELNIPFENVIRHNDASGKICPKSLSENNWEKWYWFKEQLVDNVSPYTNPSTVDCTNELLWRGLITDQNFWNKKAESDEDIKWLFIKYYTYIMENGGSIKDRELTSDEAIGVLMRCGIINDYEKWNEKAWIGKDDVYWLLINMADYIN